LRQTQAPLQIVVGRQSYPIGVIQSVIVAALAV
jgi:hypothetical protein